MLLGVPGPREAAPARNNLNRRVGAAGNGVRAAVVRVEAHAGQGVRGVPEGVGVYRHLATAQASEMMLSNLDTPRNLQNAGPTITLTLDQSQLAGNSIDPTLGVT